MEKKTILIFGVSSFVGSNLIEVLKDNYRIIGTYHKTPVSIPGITCIPCDVLKKDYVTNITARFQPNLTIFAVGMTSLKECHLLPKQSDAINSAGAVNCCAASERYGAKFIYISSSYVLGGESILYKEGDIPFPNTTYGSSLSSTEFYIQRSCLNYLILRSAPLYGRSFNPRHANWFEHLQTALSKGEAISVDDSVETGFLDVQIMAEILKVLLTVDVNNRLFHISTSDFMTRYSFAKSYAKIFRKDQSLIQRANSKFPIDKKNNNAENSNYYYRLDTTNLQEFLNIKMPSIEESLTVTYKRLGG